MTREQKLLVADALPFGLAGLVLLALVYFTPHAGSHEGRSFFAVAVQSPWQHWGDWAAAWCSMKIILFSLGSLSLVFWLWTTFGFSMPKILDWMLLVLVLVPGLGFFAGIYYLIRALF